MNGVKLLTKITLGLLAFGGLLVWIGSGKDNTTTIVGAIALYGGGIAFIGLIVAIVIQSIRSPNK
ncbi:MAG: hypothetical protein IAE84_05460 [Saprospiraceae bacterium]|nr:hypothetical protein [Saprospiraceae bacterium]